MRTFRFLVILLLAGALLAPAAEARAPKAYSNLAGVAYPPNGAGEALALAMDAQGRFVYVALKPDPNPTCGTSTGDLLGTPLPCRPDLAAYDLDLNKGSPAGTQGTNARPNNDAALPTAVAVTPAGEGSGPRSVWVAKAGPGAVFAVFQAGNAAPTFERRAGDVNWETVAINGDSTRLALGGSTVAGAGQISVWNCCTSTMTQRWNFTFANEGVNAVATARSGNALVVGTDKAVYYLPDMDARPNTSPLNYFTKVTGGSPVRSVDVSADGSAVVAGLENGDVYYFLAKDAVGSSSRDLFEKGYFAANLRGSVVSVAVSGDGQWFAGATAGKEFGLWRASATPEGAVAIEQYRDDLDATPIRVDASDKGNTFVVAAGASVLGYTTARGAPSWTLTTADEVKGVAISADGNQVAAASKTRFYAWQQLSEVTIAEFADDKERRAQPNEVLPFSFTVTNSGSMQDNYTIEVRKPGASWAVNGERQWRLLSPDASARVNFTLQSPLGERPAKHMGWVEVFSQGQNRVVHREFFNVSIAQVSNLRLDTDQGRSLTLNQGEEIQYTFRIINQGNSYARLNLSVSQAVQPSGPPWTVTNVPDREINLTAGNELAVTVNIVAPRDVPDGTCNTITFAARAGVAGASLPVTACINPEYAIGVLLEQTTLAVRSGETAVVKVQIQNRGNVQDTVRLEAQVAPAQAALDWTVKVDPAEIDLPLKGVRTATLSVRPAVQNPPDVTITVRATSEGGAPAQQASLTAGAPQAEDDGFLAPGPGLLAFAFALAAAAALAARRRER